MMKIEMFAAFLVHVPMKIELASHAEISVMLTMLELFYFGNCISGCKSKTVKEIKKENNK